MVLSLCMIVKDEEKDLPRCLESVKNIVDEIIIVDTGSADDTVKIAESYGAKVYYYPWNGSFSDARNFSISKAVGDWLMILDADDELEKCDPIEYRSLMNETDVEAYYFETISYVGEEPGLDAVRSPFIRLIKNKKGYGYIGSIHEQIYGSIIAINPSAKIIQSHIKVYHYGYLNKSIEEKDKRNRNMILLEKELEQYPGYHFTMYNLGSEYCAMENYEKALELFEKIFQNFDPNEGFGSVMVFKMVYCYMELKRYADALRLCNEGLAHYPQFTDLEYMKGVVYRETGNVKEAVCHFERCCEMGEAPICLGVIEGMGTYRSLFALGEIYFDLGNYDASAECFIKVLLQKPGFEDALRMFVKTYCKLQLDDEKVKNKIDEIVKQLRNGYDDVSVEQLIKESRHETTFISQAMDPMAVDFIDQQKKENTI